MKLIQLTDQTLVNMESVTSAQYHPVGEDDVNADRRCEIFLMDDGSPLTFYGDEADHVWRILKGFAIALLSFQNAVNAAVKDQVAS
jgi:hypothetical protein